MSGGANLAGPMNPGAYHIAGESFAFGVARAAALEPAFLQSALLARVQARSS